MHKLTAKICESCYNEKQERIDDIFSNKHKVRSWHKCAFCKDKTHWEFSKEFSSESELQNAKGKYQNLII